MANCFYTSRVVSEITIDEDESGLIALIPSESEEDTSHVVSCEEHKSGVTAKSCSCKGFYYRKSCKHIEIAQGYWDTIYKPAAKVAPVKKERKPRNGLVRKVRNGGLIKVEQKPVVEEEVKAEAEAAIAEAEKIVATKSDVKATVTAVSKSAKTTNIGLKGNLTSKAFSILRR